MLFTQRQEWSKEIPVQFVLRNHEQIYKKITTCTTHSSTHYKYYPLNLIPMSVAMSVAGAIWMGTYIWLFSVQLDSHKGLTLLPAIRKALGSHILK